MINELNKSKVKIWKCASAQKGLRILTIQRIFDSLSINFPKNWRGKSTWQ